MELHVFRHAKNIDVGQQNRSNRHMEYFASLPAKPKLQKKTTFLLSSVDVMDSLYLGNSNSRGWIKEKEPQRLHKNNPSKKTSETKSQVYSYLFFKIIYLDSYKIINGKTEWKKNCAFYLSNRCSY